MNNLITCSFVQIIQTCLRKFYLPQKSKKLFPCTFKILQGENVGIITIFKTYFKHLKLHYVCVDYVKLHYV